MPFAAAAAAVSAAAVSAAALPTAALPTAALSATPTPALGDVDFQGSPVQSLLVEACLCTVGRRGIAKVDKGNALGRPVGPHGQANAR